MVQKNKGSGKPESSKESPRKKAKVSNGNSEGQSKLGNFVKTPDKKGNVNGSLNKKEGIISLLSDSEPGEEGDVEHIPVASASKKCRMPADGEVIDLEDVLSSDSDNDDVKPIAGPSTFKNDSNAAVHPMFRKTAIKLEEGPGRSDNGAVPQDRAGKEEEDIKPVIDRKGKGKAETGSDSPRKLIFPKIENDEPVAYPLEKDIFEFNPKTDISTDTWPRTQAGKLHTPYSFLVAAFVLISATRSRLIIVTVLTNTLRTIVEYDPETLKDAVYLVSKQTHTLGFPQMGYLSPTTRLPITLRRLTRE